MKKMNRKVLLTLGTTTTVIAPIASVIACSSSDDEQKEEQVINKDQEIVNKVKIKDFLHITVLSDALPSTIMVPSEGFTSTGVVFSFTDWKPNNDLGVIEWKAYLVKGNASKTKRGVIHGFQTTEDANKLLLANVHRIDLHIPPSDSKTVPSDVNKPSDGLTVSGVTYSFTQWVPHNDSGSINWTVHLSIGNQQTDITGVHSGYKSTDVVAAEKAKLQELHVPNKVEVATRADNTGSSNYDTALTKFNGAITTGNAASDVAGVQAQLDIAVKAISDMTLANVTQTTANAQALVDAKTILDGLTAPNIVVATNGANSEAEADFNVALMSFNTTKIRGASANSVDAVDAFISTANDLIDSMNEANKKQIFANSNIISIKKKTLADLTVPDKMEAITGARNEGAREYDIAKKMLDDAQTGGAATNVISEVESFLTTARNALETMKAANEKQIIANNLWTAKTNAIKDINDNHPVKDDTKHNPALYPLVEYWESWMIAAINGAANQDALTTILTGVQKENYDKAIADYNSSTI